MPKIIEFKSLDGPEVFRFNDFVIDREMSRAK